LVFSLEMSAAQLALRMLCSRARVNMKLLRDGLLSKNGDEQNRLVQVADEFSKAPIFIDDSSALSIMQLRAKARRIHARTPLGFIVVDYLQLLSPTDAKPNTNVVGLTFLSRSNVSARLATRVSVSSASCSA
jgi:replicative DNA helicase